MKDYVLTVHNEVNMSNTMKKVTSTPVDTVSVKDADDGKVYLCLDDGAQVVIVYYDADNGLFGTMYISDNTTYRIRAEGDLLELHEILTGLIEDGYERMYEFGTVKEALLYIVKMI